MTAAPRLLCDQTFPRTLEAWVQEFSQARWQGARIQAWLFEDRAARLAAEQRLAAAGVQAQFLSAYKPLVFHCLEQIDLRSLSHITVHYPVHPQANPQRFLLEAYPLAALLDQARVGCRFVAGGADLHYCLEYSHRDGRTSHGRVWAPNRLHTDRLGQTMLSPTGWLRAWPALASATATATAHEGLDCARQTDYEQLFDTALRVVAQHNWPKQEPYFERLELRCDLPGIELRLPVGHETISTHEGLHEDLYFGLLEIFQHRSGRAALDRRLQPGQVVPDVRHSNQSPRLRISLQSFAPLPAADAGHEAQTADPKALEVLELPPSTLRIARELSKLPGQRWQASSRQGRPVEALYRLGNQAPVFISGGQHANETSGIVGALRAAQALARQPQSHFALLPLENPDGYALHQELCLQQPQHMHHAARYSALGDDIEYRESTPLYERAARRQALALSGAQLHVNLHGYPAHEWTRPLSGYIPSGFEQWTLPKGLFLILRYHPGWQAEGEALLEQVCLRLAQIPQLMVFNAQQIALFERHAGPLQFEKRHGTAVTVSEVYKPDSAPVTLITEFPDETVVGDDYRFAHTMQMQATLAACAAWQTLARQEHSVAT